MTYALIVAGVAAACALILVAVCAVLEIDQARRDAMEFLRRDGGR